LKPEARESCDKLSSGRNLLSHAQKKLYKTLIPSIRLAGPQEDDNEAVPDERGAIKAIHHGQRFSRKLKRRLTQRTIAEARALKKQSKEAIHVLFYAAELVSKIQ